MASSIIFSPGTGTLIAPGDVIQILWLGATQWDSIDVYFTTHLGEEQVCSWVQADGQTNEGVTNAIADGYTEFGRGTEGGSIGVRLGRSGGWDRQDGTLNARVEIVDDGTPETWTASYTVSPVLGVDHYEPAHTATGLGRLLEQFQGSVNLRSLLSTYLDGAQDFEDVAYQIINARSLDIVSGHRLDGLGQIVNLPRSGLSDEDYRLRIRAELAVLTSQGSIEDLITILSLLIDLGTPPDVEIVEYFPKTIAMRPVDFVLTDDPNIIGVLLKRTVSAATRLWFVYSENLDDETYQLSSLPTTVETSSLLGLSNDAQSSGGYLANVV
jgi:hypothetical protein